jgi:peptidoglycan-associated lipoprotein
MTKIFSKKLISVAIFALATSLLLVSGCKKPVYPNCSDDSQCKVGPNGEAMSGVCVMGKCEECAVNTDCQNGMQCVSNVCMMPCTGDAECGDGKHCQGGFCRKNCDATNACGGGLHCLDGRCVSGEGERSCSTSGTVHFDFNKYDIKGEDDSTLNEIGMCLKKETDVKIVVEGNCDERGSSEYNMALGNRRAAAVRDYLTNNGISSDRIKTVSYGKENPVDQGHSEEAWAKNRRSDVKPQ